MNLMIQNLLDVSYGFASSPNNSPNALISNAHHHAHAW
jgi:hypothetical protein